MLGEFTFEGISKDETMGEPLTKDPVPAAATADKARAASGPADEVPSPEI